MTSSTRIREDHQKYYAVKKIIGVHIDENNNTYYQIEWEPTWEDADNLIGCEHLIKEFWMRRSEQCFCNFPNIKQEPADSVYTTIDNSDVINATSGSSLYSGGHRKETDYVQRSDPSLDAPSAQLAGAPPLLLKRKSRMTLSNLNMSPLKRKLSENAARAMKSSSTTISRMQRSLSRIVSPTNSKPCRRKGFGLRAGSLIDSARNSSNKKTLKSEKSSTHGDNERNFSSSHLASNRSSHRQTHTSATTTATKKHTDGILSEDSISLIIERDQQTTLNNSDLTSVVSEDEEDDDDSDDGTDSQDDEDDDDGRFSSETLTKFESYTNLFRNLTAEDSNTTTRPKSNKAKRSERPLKQGGMLGRKDDYPSSPPKLRNYVNEFNCQLCVFNAFKKDELKRHYARKHSLTKKAVNVLYKCGQCDKQFKKKSHLVSHLMNHTKLGANPYKCSVCADVSFSNVHELESHHFTHEFNLGGTYNKSTRVRLGTFYTKDKGGFNKLEELHQCKRCKRKFASNRALLMHCRRRKHGNKYDNSKPMAIKSISNIKSEDRTTATTTTATSKAAIKNTLATTSSKNKQQSIQAKIKAKYKKQKKIANRNATSKVSNRPSFDHHEFMQCPYCPNTYSNKNRTGLYTLNLHMEVKHKDKAFFDVVSGMEAFSKCPFCTRLFISVKALENHVVNIHKIDKSKVSEIATAILTNTKTRVKNNKVLSSTNKNAKASVAGNDNKKDSTANPEVIFSMENAEKSLKDTKASGASGTSKLPAVKSIKARKSIATRLRNSAGSSVQKRSTRVRHNLPFLTRNNSMFNLRRLYLKKGETSPTNWSTASGSNSDALETFAIKKRRGRPKLRPTDPLVTKEEHNKSTKEGGKESSVEKQLTAEKQQQDNKGSKSSAAEPSKKKFQCKYCLRTYQSMQSAKKHIMIAHPNNRVTIIKEIK